MGRSAIFGERKHDNRAITLSDRQISVLRFMWVFYLENDCLPTRNEVAKEFGFKSWNAAEEHMRALERKGFIEPNALPGKFRFSAKSRALLAVLLQSEADQVHPRTIPSPTPSCIVQEGIPADVAVN